MPFNIEKGCQGVRKKGYLMAQHLVKQPCIVISKRVTA